MNLDNRIEITNDKGEVLEGEIVFVFKEHGEEYVIYTIEDVAYAAKIDQNGNLNDIPEDEWAIVEKIFAEYQESLEEE